MSKINDYLTEAGVFFLATTDGNQPKVRPLGAHVEMDGKVILGIGDFKNVYKQMLANPLVEIVACKNDGHWMRYTGKAVFETDSKYAEAMLDGAPHFIVYGSYIKLSCFSSVPNPHMRMIQSA